MGPPATLLWIALLAADSSSAATSDEIEAEGDVTAEPSSGAGITPIELVPRLEVRQQFFKLPAGVTLHQTTMELDIQFVNRLLLRYQVPWQTLEAGPMQVQGLGDIQITAIGIVTSNPTLLTAVVVGGVLNSATQAPLGAGKDQIVLGGGAAAKPRRWCLLYGVVQEQHSVGGDSARPEVNQLSGLLGGILFGRQYNWLRVDLNPTLDFPGTHGRLYASLEVGSLLVGRVGLFMRAATQPLGERQLDYSVTAGVRYLFRLEKGKPK
jgi:hypothetical protein